MDPFTLFVLTQAASAPVVVPVDIPNVYNVLNLVASAGLIFAAGKLVNRLDEAEKRIKELEKGDVARGEQSTSIAVLNTKMDALQVGMDDIKEHMGSARWKLDSARDLMRGGD